MKAKDIMNENVYVVRPDDSVKQAAELICRHSIAGVPVVNDIGELIGIVSEKDLIHAMYPDYGEFNWSTIKNMDFEEIENNYHDMHNVKVKEIMIGNVITATPDTPILKLGSVMLLERVRRIPIVIGNKLVGIVSQGDVHRAAFKCQRPRRTYEEQPLVMK